MRNVLTLEAVHEDVEKNVRQEFMPGCLAE